MCEPPASDDSVVKQTPATTEYSCHGLHRGAQSLDRLDEQASSGSAWRPGEFEVGCSIGGADYWRKRPASYCGSVMVSAICRIEVPNCPAAAHRYHGEFEKVAIEDLRVRSCPQEDWRNRVVTCASQSSSQKTHTATGRAASQLPGRCNKPGLQDFEPRVLSSLSVGHYLFLPCASGGQ